MANQDDFYDKYLSISRWIFYGWLAYSWYFTNSYICTHRSQISMEIWLLSYPGFCLCYPGFMFKTGTCHVQGTSLEVFFIHRKPMTPKKCMSIAKSLSDTQHMEPEPLCTVSTWKQSNSVISFIKLDLVFYCLCTLLDIIHLGQKCLGCVIFWLEISAIIKIGSNSFNPYILSDFCGYEAKNKCFLKNNTKRLTEKKNFFFWKLPIFNAFSPKLQGLILG